MCVGANIKELAVFIHKDMCLNFLSCSELNLSLSVEILATLGFFLRSVRPYLKLHKNLHMPESNVSLLFFYKIESFLL
jgi:hypothetical protein